MVSVVNEFETEQCCFDVVLHCVVLQHETSFFSRSACDVCSWRTADADSTSQRWTLTLWRPLLPYGYGYPVPDRVKPAFVIFDIRALRRSGLSIGVPGCQKLQMPV